jgi:diguanylate cyclase (GGDEF)-like protein
MLRLDPSKLRIVAEQLKQATDEHAEWHENLLRSIFCGLPVEVDDLEPFSHRTCCIGRWYYERAPAELREQPAFVAMGVEHERLHAVAARLLAAAKIDGPVVRADFEGLVATSARLRIEVDSLRLSIEASLTNRDALTGAYGRFAMLPELHELRAAVMRGGKPCCIVFMDVDHLKRINDAHGHQVGDAVLSGIVNHLESHLRPQDKVFRYGGDEFLISLPGADLSTAQSVVTRVREGLARNLMIAGPQGTALHVTASFGLAPLDAEADVSESIGRADQALMLAKTAGRNRAISWDASVTTSTRWRRIQADQAPG